MAIIKDIVERRVNTTGVSEPVVTTQGKDRVVVELPGVTDPEAVRRLVGQTGRLDFVPLGSTQAQTGQVLDPQAVPTAVQRRPGLVGHGRHGPERPAGGRLRAQGRRQEQVRGLHQGQHRQLLRDHARRRGRLGAGHPELDPGRERPDHRRRAGGLHGQGRDRARHRPQVRLAAVPDHRALERADQRHARRAVPQPDRPRGPARDRPGHRVHAHLLPAARTRRQLRARSTTRS